MSLSKKKKGRLVMDKKGIHYRDVAFAYPIKIGRVRNFRGLFKNVVVELKKRGANYYLYFYDSYKGMVGYGQISKTDAYNLVKNQFAKMGYDDDIQISDARFAELVRSIDFKFID